MFDWFKKKTVEKKNVVETLNSDISFEDLMKEEKEKFIETNIERIKKLDEKKSKCVNLNHEIIKLKVENSPEMAVVYHRLFDYSIETEIFTRESYAFHKMHNHGIYTIFERDEFLDVIFFDLNGIQHNKRFNDSSLFVKVKKSKGK